jgi:hypothetical protein
MLPSPSQRQSSQRKTRIRGSCEDFNAQLNGKLSFIAQDDKEFKWGGLSRRSELGIISHAVCLHQVLQKTGLCRRRPRLTIRIRGVLELLWRSVDQRDVPGGRWSATDRWQKRSLKINASNPLPPRNEIKRHTKFQSVIAEGLRGRL